MREPRTYVKAIALSGLDETVKRLGGDPASLYERAGLPADVLKQPDQLISFQKFCSLLELAGQETQRDFGLQWAMDQQPNFINLGPIALLSHFTKTAREWFETGMHYFTFHNNGFKFAFVEHPDPDLETIRYYSDSFMLPARQVVEHAFACLLLVSQHGCNAHNDSPTRVSFQHAKPEDTSTHDKIFRCPIDWGAAHNEFTFEKRLFAYPTSGNLAFLKPLMAYFVRRRIDKLEHYDQSATTNLMMAIPSIIGTGHCKIDFLATSLGVNVRALQSQLSDEGTTFSEVLDRVRQNMAKNYLAETDIPVARIAELLEYSGTAAFTTAFQRWTGTSPLKFRQASNK